MPSAEQPGVLMDTMSWYRVRGRSRSGQVWTYSVFVRATDEYDAVQKAHEKESDLLGPCAVMMVDEDACAALR